MDNVDFVAQKQRERVEAVSLVSPRYAAFFERAYSGNSRSIAIKAFCLDCCGLDRVSVKECTVLACPLFKFRQYQGDQDDEGVAEDQGEDGQGGILD